MPSVAAIDSSGRLVSRPQPDEPATPGDEAHIKGCTRDVYRMLCTVREVNRFFVIEVASKIRTSPQGITYACGELMQMINVLCSGGQ
jgi:hypothetical protein